MNHHNFLLNVIDTDSISFCKQDMSPFSDKEQEDLIEEINSYMPKLIKFAHDGYFKKVIVFKAKNYILYDGQKIKTKGSAITDQKKEPALRNLLSEMVNVLLEIDTTNTLLSIYNKYIIESQRITDISRWATKKTITEAVNTSERLNESKVRDAIQNETVQQGDKIYCYPAIAGHTTEILKSGKEKHIPVEILKLTKNWSHDEDKEHFLHRVYATVKILENVVDLSQFPKYHLVKNKGLLEELLCHK